jgi:hypothetical protein
MKQWKKNEKFKEIDEMYPSDISEIGLIGITFSYNLLIFFFFYVNKDYDKLD